MVITVGKDAAPAAVLADLLGEDIPRGADVISIGDKMPQVLADAIAMVR